MKKILIFILIFPIYVLALDTNTSTKNAMSAYEKNDFKIAYFLLKKDYLKNLSDIKINFALGRSAYETGNYETALAAFERVEMLDPTSIRNKLELARTYFMLKMYEDSELAFQEVLENPNIPENLRTNIELYFSKVKKVQQKSFTYATVNLDWVYDSNVNYGTLDDNYNISTGSLAGIDEESDNAIQAFTNIINIYDIGSKNGFAVKNKLTLFSKDYKNMNDYDVQYVGYTPSVIYKETKYLTELGLDLAMLRIANKQYLRTLGIVPKLEYSHSNTLKSISHLKLQKKDFKQKIHEDLNAKHYEVSYALQKILSPRSYIQGNITGIAERKEQGERVDVDYNEYKADINYAKQFNATYGTEFYAQYRKRYYKNYSSIFASQRIDEGRTIAATIKANIMKTLNIHLKGSYTRVGSNQDRFSYEKSTLTIGLNKTF
ncbi:surface lipoprotein assembly modifier [Arcobacteraceae bacterium]|nr:surface lipoprotein assembly modifier [Arcobacteraceae bacterium]